MDLDKLWLTAPCPLCRYEFDLRFQQVRLQERVFCPVGRQNPILVLLYCHFRHLGARRVDTPKGRRSAYPAGQRRWQRPTESAATAR